MFMTIFELMKGVCPTPSSPNVIINIDHKEQIKLHGITGAAAA